MTPKFVLNFHTPTSEEAKKISDNQLEQQPLVTLALDSECPAVHYNKTPSVFFIDHLTQSKEKNASIFS